MLSQKASIIPTFYPSTHCTNDLVDTLRSPPSPSEETELQRSKRHQRVRWITLLESMESRGFIPHYGRQEGNARGSLPFCEDVDCSAIILEKQPPARRQGDYRGEEKGGQGATAASTSTTDIMEEEKTGDKEQGKAATSSIIEREMNLHRIFEALLAHQKYVFVSYYQIPATIKDASDMQPENSCLYTS